MKIIYSESYNIDIGNHPFNTGKYEKIIDFLLTNSLIHKKDIIVPGFIDFEDVYRVHTFSYLEKLDQLKFDEYELGILGMPISKEIVDASWISAEGTLLACRQSLHDGICVHTGGGWHHAFASCGSGFCLINDIAVAIRAMKARGEIERALIIDLDLHQGDGTAKIFQQDSDVFTFSMHQNKLFPFLKQKSNLDVSLEKNVSDDEYLSKLTKFLNAILYKNYQYDIILYQAGVDPYISDPLGDLQISTEGLKKRDRIVFEKATQFNIPIAVTLGGGYSEEAVNLHINTILEALFFSTNYGY